jgi:hypothetical protein
MRKLREEQIVKLMFPAFDEEKHSLPQDAQTCTGTSIFADPLLRGAQLVRRNAWPFVEQEGDITYGSGGDRLKIVWLRTHQFGDGSAGGPIAVIRSGQRFAELFAIGAYRGQPEHTRLATARMGREFLLTAENDGCTGHKQGDGCQTTLSVFLPRRGAFAPVVDVPVERVAYSGRAERGSMGALEYHLTSVPEFREDSIRLVEQVRVKDDSGRELRKAEHERLFSVDDKGVGAPAEPSLWDQIVKSDEAHATPQTGGQQAPAPRGAEPRRPAETGDARPPPGH